MIEVGIFLKICLFLAGRNDHTLNYMKAQLLTLVAPAFVSLAASAAFGESPVKAEQETLIPKRETGVLEFLKKHPEFDGRGTVIAVFDTGVDPAAAGLLTTSTGERKILDVIDATGSGDVDTSHVVEATEKRELQGLTGRTLKLPKKVKNPSGKFHLGIKQAKDLFRRGVNRRISNLRAEAWQSELGLIKDKRSREQNTPDEKAFTDLSLKEKDALARKKFLEGLEEDYLASDPGPVYDCVVWFNGKDFQVIVDTDEDGDLNDEKVLRPFGVAGEFGTLSDEEASTFAVQVYEEGKLLSLVTVDGSHGSHVASIASAHFPAEPHRDGIAPGAQILSVKIGDSRMGGSSSGVGEMRGVAACAQYGVDVMNASWGGASQYQDGRAGNVQLYNMLVEKYGVTAFISAGNSGPGLSTLGSPGGDASSAIGVGAYVSSEMSRVLYSQTTPGPDTAYNFSARGPCKNGDLGVDIMGPGGAHASLAYDELSNSQRYHGTSMSSPSVAGLGALLISAAKQSEMESSPARIRAALMNSARFMEGVEVFAQGAGLVQALPAWEHFKRNFNQEAWDHFYTVRTRSNTFSDGPGLYLRGDIPVGKREVRFDLKPKFAARVNASEKFAFENDLVFSATEAWVKIPGYARLGNGEITIRPVLDIPKSQVGQPLYAEIHGRLAGSPEGGPLVRIPITIVRGEKTDPHLKHRANFSLKLKSGQSDRRFFQVPENANFLKVRMRRENPDSLMRILIVHAVTVAADESFNAYSSEEFAVLEQGGEKEFTVPVIPGKTTELAFHQPFFAGGDTSVEVDLQFVGMAAQQDALVFRENDEHIPLRVVSASDVKVRGGGMIDQAHYSKLPEKTEFLSPDKRDVFPPGPRRKKEKRPAYLKQTFTLSMGKPTQIQLKYARRYGAFSEFNGGLILASHESGQVLYHGSSYRSGPISLPKGVTTFTRTLRTLSRADLEREQDRPLAWTMKLKKGVPLQLFPSMREVVKGAKAGTVHLRKGRYQSLMVGASDLPSLASHEPSPQYFSGKLSLEEDGGNGLQFLEIGVECRPGEDFSKVANQEKEPASLNQKVEKIDQLEKGFLKEKIAFVDAHKFSKDEKVIAKRDDLLSELLTKNPKNPAVHLLHAEIHAAEVGLLGELPKPGKKKGRKAAAKKRAAVLKDVRESLRKARSLCQPAVVARYFGAPSEDDDATLEERKKKAGKDKKMATKRDHLVSIALIEAKVLLRAGKLTPVRRALREARRWQAASSEEYGEIEYDLLKKEGHLGLALKMLDERLGESPFDEKLLNEKIELFEKLGYDRRFADRVRLAQQIRKAGLK